MSICDKPEFAIRSTTQISESDKKFTIMPNPNAAVGSRKDRAIFKYPVIKIKATNGKVITVQMLVSGLIV